MDGQDEDLDPWGGSDEEVTCQIYLSFSLSQMLYSLMKHSENSFAGQPLISFHLQILPNWR